MTVYEWYHERQQMVGYCWLCGKLRGRISKLGIKEVKICEDCLLDLRQGKIEVVGTWYKDKDEVRRMISEKLYGTKQMGD